MISNQNEMDTLNYTDFMCFRINAIARRIARAHGKVCAEHGITAGQSFILFDLLNDEGSTLTEISTRVQLDNPAVGAYIDRLIKEDLVVRVDDPKDRRLYRIYLTNKGRRLAEELLPKTRDVHIKIANLIDGDDFSIFSDSLTKLEQGL